WAGLFFGVGSAPGTGLGGVEVGGRSGVLPQVSNPTSCGRFSADVCAAYQAAATAGTATPEILALTRASSPATVLSDIRAPTLLIQGETDSLFPLSEADANARGIAPTGTPVKVVWYGGGHDGGDTEAARLRSLTRAWFDRYLRRDGSAADTRFEVTEVAAGLSTTDSTAAPTVRFADRYPGVSGGAAVASVRMGLSGGTQTIVSPAGGTPAEVTSLPGLGAALGQLGVGLGALPGQDAGFDTAPLSRDFRLVGAPAVDIRIASRAGDATVFAKLYDVAADGSAAVLPQQLASPVRLVGLPAGGRTVRISLPAVVHDFPAGHRMRVVVSSTDQAYALPPGARTYRVSLAGDSALVLPSVSLQAAPGVSRLLILFLVAAALVLVVLGWWLLRRRRRSLVIADAASELALVPLVISGVGKAYGDGFRAVSDLTFRVERSQVVGLLGPNGAGKTTTMRMLLGLIRPSEGEMRVFGHRITAGAPVLSRVGALVEGPGFLPHLSGRANLELFWRATGRPLAAARLEEALAIAGLGPDVERKVRKYSHGMRQRLAIAQAMLGLPELLVLDEPTDGLDPPQIREMREVLRTYASEGRTVLISSHLLAEVEQTCTHCVVMDHGRLVAQGSVAELVGASTSVAVVVDDPARAAVIARGLGATEIVTSATGLTLTLDGTGPAALVRALVEAGLSVGQLAPQRRLEQAFLSLVGERE
ncbi:MAG: ATP-binding cassette domain-containing protein, partial [Actinomycetota bacterium]|nr:ATP-binding cassette domain-containing protein [Actinomycetota bacterium]